MTTRSPLRSRWTDQFKTLDANSNFHNEVREILAGDPWFKNFKCYQEVPVADVCEGYEPRSHRFDWYIPDLNVVIELHGRQHYQPVNFGNQSYNKVQQNYRQMRARDNAKRQAAEEAGMKFVEIPYKLQGKLTAEMLKELILND